MIDQVLEARNDYEAKHEDPYDPSKDLKFAHMFNGQILKEQYRTAEDWYMTCLKNASEDNC